MTTKPAKSKLFYIHDPMCSWCWGFAPTWLQLKQCLQKEFTNLEIKYILGGLAPDTNDPMPFEQRQTIERIWYKIQKRIPNTQFNFDYWQTNTPKRSTYPACRAVICARNQNTALEDAMILQIQTAYYLNAQNPSNDDVLIECTEKIGLDINQFKADLHNANIKEQHQLEIDAMQKLGATHFPSLVLELDERHIHHIKIDYTDASSMFNQIKALL